MSDVPVSGEEPTTDDEVGGGYAKYVLGVLVVVYVFNFIDRQILSILAEEIKADLGLSDADIGFLYGTAFAVFYAVFGIPLGRLADVWTRKSLISLGLAFWSVMTALSGTARSFLSLSIFRFGVGIGEASATPAAFSMLSDYFPPKLRATALAIYSSGVYIGAGIGVFLGGFIVDTWNGAWPNPADSPFGLKGWHAAFFVVGLPGLLMALWVWRLREPVRGISEGNITEPHPTPFKEFFESLASVLPPLTFFSLYFRGGMKVLITNVVWLGLILLVAWGLVIWTGDATQWWALSIGVYAMVAWIQGLQLSDPVTFGMIFKSRAVLFASIGFPFIAFITYGIGFWSPPYMLRAHGVALTEAATFLGLGSALGGWMGVTLGGVLSDRYRERNKNSRLYVGMFSAFLAVPAGYTFLLTDTIWVAYTAAFVFSIVSPMWVGAGASTINDLVLPRMRALTSAYYILMITFIGLALGPYLVGRVSVFYSSTGLNDGDALRVAMMWGLGAALFALLFLFLASRHMPEDERTRVERARALGEKIA